MTRTVSCHCGATAESPGGFLMEEAKATGFYPVIHHGGFRWFCPEHTRQLAAAVEVLKAACGGDVSHILPPMLRDMRWKP